MPSQPWVRGSRSRRPPDVALRDKPDARARRRRYGTEIRETAKPIKVKNPVFGNKFFRENNTRSAYCALSPQVRLLRSDVGAVQKNQGILEEIFGRRAEVRRRHTPGNRTYRSNRRSERSEESPNGETRRNSEIPRCARNDGVYE